MALYKCDLVPRALISLTHPTSGTRGVMSLWLSSPWPAGLMVGPSMDGSTLTIQGAGFNRAKSQLYSPEYLVNAIIQPTLTPLHNVLRCVQKGWTGDGSCVEHVPAVVVAFVVCCMGQHSGFVSHLGEKVELSCKDLTSPLLVVLPRLLHLLCADGHPLSLVAHIIMIAAGFAAVSHCFLSKHFSVRQFISFYVSGKNYLLSSVFQWTI